MKIRSGDLVIMAEYGFNPYSAREVRAYLRETRREPLSLSGYRRAVRAALKRAGLDSSIDGRLIEAVYKSPTIIPSDWPTRGMEWLRYWREVAERPDVVGSSYNPTPQGAAWAWALGVPAAFARGAKCLDVFIPPADRRMSSTRIEAAYKLARIPFRAGTGPALRTADMRRLAKLPKWALSVLASSDLAFPIIYQGDVNWSAVAKLVNFASTHRPTFEKAGFKAGEWREQNLPLARLCAAAHEAGLPHRLTRCALRYNATDALAPLIKLGLAKFFAGTSFSGKELWGFAYKIKEAIDAGWSPATGKPFATIHELVESVDAFLSLKPNNRTISRSSLLQAAYRRADRRAQRDRNWAIEQYRAEYERGKRIAPVMREVVEFLVDRLHEQTVIIHGRDGELIYQLILWQLKKLPRKLRALLRRRLIYAITSRPLLQSMTGNFRAYLARRIKAGCLHIDTGFAGSVPRRIMSELNLDGTILLVSAADPDKQLPISDDAVRAACPGGLREMVLADLEHAHQRLILPTGSEWGSLSYSPSAPGFWARFYGVIDFLDGVSL